MGHLELLQYSTVQYIVVKHKRQNWPRENEKMRQWEKWWKLGRIERVIKIHCFLFQDLQQGHHRSFICWFRSITDYMILQEHNRLYDTSGAQQIICWFRSITDHLLLQEHNRSFADLRALQIICWFRSITDYILIQEHNRLYADLGSQKNIWSTLRMNGQTNKK